MRPISAPILAGCNRVTFAYVALQRVWRLGCGLSLGVLRLGGLGGVLTIALAHAAIVRWTSDPAAAALARSRAGWFHHWSGVVCWVLGFRVEHRGFVPASGLIFVKNLSLIDVLLLASVAPLAIVVDAGVRRLPIFGWAGRLAGVLFRDPRSVTGVERINFQIGRALRQRQIVVLARTCSWFNRSVAKRPQSALFKPAIDACSSLTACAILNGRTNNWTAAARILMRPRSEVAIAFHPPVYHPSQGKQLADQLWREVQVLESAANESPETAR